MPTYVYQCRKCQNSFDVQQKITDDPLTVLAHTVGVDPVHPCDGVVTRVIAPSVGSGFVLKGGGWYKDGY